MFFRTTSERQLWILVVFILSILLLLASKLASPRMPKIIWTYWDDQAMPTIVQACIESWKRHNPDHDVRVVMPHTLRTYVHTSLPPHLGDLSPQRRADWIRLALLMEHGGIWIDASVIATGPFNFVHEHYGGFGYHIASMTTDPRYPVIENWFIAASQEHPFIAAWFAEFDHSVRKHGSDGKAYLNALRDAHGQAAYQRLVQKIGLPEYLTMHVAAQKIMQLDGKKPYPTALAEDAPFRYHVQASWSLPRLMTLLTRQSSLTDFPDPPIVKLRGMDRERVQELADTGLVHRDSFCGRHGVGV